MNYNHKIKVEVVDFHLIVVFLLLSTTLGLMASKIGILIPYTRITLVRSMFSYKL